jgi:hypothetical protein
MPQFPSIYLWINGAEFENKMLLSKWQIVQNRVLLDLLLVLMVFSILHLLCQCLKHPQESCNAVSLVTSLQSICHIIMLNSGIGVGRILSNCPNPLVAHPILMTCMVTDAANSIHVHTVGLVIFCSNQLCRFPVDSAEVWKHHNLGNLVVGPGRGESKECGRPIHEHGMVCLVTLMLSTVSADLADVLSMDPPELQLYCCHTPLQYLADGAVHDLDYLPYLVALGPFGQNCTILHYCIEQNHTSKLTM